MSAYKKGDKVWMRMRAFDPASCNFFTTWDKGRVVSADPLLVKSDGVVWEAEPSALAPR